MATENQLIIITAPFNCGYCKKAQKELPTLCESKGWELLEIENEPGDEAFQVETYPTILIRVNEELKDTKKGYNFNSLKGVLETY